MESLWSHQGACQKSCVGGLAADDSFVRAHCWNREPVTQTNEPSAGITCSQAKFPVYATLAIVSTAVMVIVMAMLLLRIGVRSGHAERSGFVVAGVGLGISFVLGLLPLGFSLLLIASTQGLESPPVTLGRVLDEFLALGLFVAPPAAGVVSLFVAQSETVLEKLGSVERARFSFVIAAGVVVLWFAATYLAVAANCGSAVWMFR